jgi:hypothetical protein
MRGDKHQNRGQIYRGFLIMQTKFYEKKTPMKSNKFDEVEY